MDRSGRFYIGNTGTMTTKQTRYALEARIKIRYFAFAEILVIRFRFKRYESF